MALTALRELEACKHLHPLADVLRAHLIEPYGFNEGPAYLSALKGHFDKQDHALRAHLRSFKDALDAARAAAM